MYMHIVQAFMASLSVLYHLVLVLILIDSAWGVADIKLGISIIPGKQLEIAKRKLPLLLNCSALGDPEFGPLNYTWFKDGAVVMETSRVHILQNGSLFIKKVLHRIHKHDKHADSFDRPLTRSDHGLYECYAGNAVGTVLSRRVRVEVAEIGRKFDADPQNQTVIEGSVVRFHCHISGVPQPDYIWEKQRQPLKGPRFTSPLPSGILQFVDVRSSDEGAYRCVVTSHRGNHEIRHSTYAHLTVLKSPGQRPPRIVAGPASQTVTSGARVVLECLADGEPQPVITWARGDKRQILGAETTPNGNLVIRKVTAQHQGIYICIASSTDLNNIDHKSATLTVQVFPELLLSLQTRRFPYKRDARFRCIVSGKPAPTLRWFKNGRELRTGGRIKVYEDEEAGLLIQRAELTDSGYYQCIANNSVGYVTSIARLSIYQSASSPDPPSDVRVRAVSPNSLEVSWSSPSNQSNSVSWYVVMYRDVSDNSSDADAAVVSDPTVTKHRLNHLKPYTNYTIHMLALNTQGSSLASDSAQARTEESVPLKTPKIVSLESPSPTSIRVTWKKLPTHAAQGLVIEHVIYYRHGSTLQEVLVTGDEQETLLKYLKPDTVYHIRVLAATEAGFPAISSLKTWKWNEQKTAPLISNSNLVMGVDALNSTAVLVTWEVLSDQFEVSSLKLTMEKTIGSEQTGPYTVLPTDRSFILTDLENETWYEVTLEAFIDDGQSWISIGSVHTKPSQPLQQPAPPGELEGEAVTSTSILVKWLEPQSGQENIEQYSVSYMAADIADINVNTSSATVVPSKSTELVIDRLRPWTSYRVAVRSDMVQTSSPLTDPIFVTTKQDIPSDPVDVDWELLSSTSIMVTWQPPTSPNGVLTSYTVLYSPFRDVPDDQWTSVTLKALDNSVLVQNLTKELYYFKVRASTVIGPGNASQMFIVHKHDNTFHHHDDKMADKILNKVKLDNPNNSSESGGSSSGERTSSGLDLGIFLGVTMGAMVIIIAIILILFVKRRPRSSTHMPSSNRRQPPDNVAIRHCSSNGHPGMALNHVECREMSYSPMLPKLPDNEHLDTKGVALSDNPNSSRRKYPVEQNRATEGHDKVTEPLLSSHDDQMRNEGESVKEKHDTPEGHIIQDDTNQNTGGLTVSSKGPDLGLGDKSSGPLDLEPDPGQQNSCNVLILQGLPNRGTSGLHSDEGNLSEEGRIEKGCASLGKVEMTGTEGDITGTEGEITEIGGREEEVSRDGVGQGGGGEGIEVGSSITDNKLANLQPKNSRTSIPV